MLAADHDDDATRPEPMEKSDKAGEWGLGVGYLLLAVLAILAF
ncbi:hypothetical protein [Methylocystis sp. WRRC1]|nr:hypothetical protein [Methylocystis sp. WRRC1]